MRKFLVIVTILLATTCFSQEADVDIASSYNEKDLKHYLLVLKMFDTMDSYKNGYCEFACEKTGDIYKFRKEFLTAIAYYDSTDTKYRNPHQFCGNAYYMGFIPRRLKTSQCYLELKQVKKALAELTPYIFDPKISEYFDNAAISYYIGVLTSLYSKREIETELKNAINNTNYYYHTRWTVDSSSSFPNISCKLKLFDSEIELAGYETLFDKDNQIPATSRKEFFIRRFKDQEIYKQLVN